MISGSIGKYGKFRLWCDFRHAFLCPDVDGEAVFDLGVVERSSPDIHDLIIEVMIPRGARVLYGMLGIIYPVSEESVIHFNQLSLTSELLPGYGAPLIRDFESVSFGLPESYSRAAKEGFRRASFDGIQLNPNRIGVFYAAHGDVSSSEQIFEKIGFVLAHLIVGQSDDDFEKTITSLLERI